MVRTVCYNGEICSRSWYTEVLTLHVASVFYNGEIRGANRSEKSSLADNYDNCRRFGLETFFSTPTLAVV